MSRCWRPSSAADIPVALRGVCVEREELAVVVTVLKVKLLVCKMIVVVRAAHSAAVMF